MRKAEIDEKKRPAKTFNYPKDSHGKFCRRCLEHHKACPITRGRPSDTCTL